MTLTAARSVSREHLPLIDIAALRSGVARECHEVVDKIGSACRDKGFFYIVGHGISPHLIDDAVTQMRKFFALPLDAKLATRGGLIDCRRGYEPIGGQMLDPGTMPDLKEAFDVGTELPATDPRVTAGKFNHGPNHWPSGMPGFRSAMDAYFPAMLDLSQRLLSAIGLSLGLADDHFDGFYRDPVAILRLLHYPSQQPHAIASEIGAGAHTDWGAITILLQDDVGGLQIQDGESWIHVQPIPGSYVVNLGDLIARWTNDRFRSTVHRVVNFSGRDRYSIPFFYDGNPDYHVACLPNCSGPEDPPKYRPITGEGHIIEMQRRADLRTHARRHDVQDI